MSQTPLTMSQLQPMQPKGFIYFYNRKVSWNMRRDVYQAIADPIRREILNMISHRSLSINSVSENFDVSRTAVYKHIKILTECGLVVIRQKGRERYCEPRLDKLSEVSDWLKQYQKFWTRRFDTLDSYLKEAQANKKTKRIVKISKKKARHLANVQIWRLSIKDFSDLPVNDLSKSIGLH